MGQEETSELVDELGLGIDSEITYIKWSNIDKDVSFNIPKLSRIFTKVHTQFVLLIESNLILNIIKSFILTHTAPSFSVNGSTPLGVRTSRDKYFQVESDLKHTYNLNKKGKKHDKVIFKTGDESEF